MNHSPVDILLVEDSEDDAELTIRTLKKNNVAKYIVHMKDGAEALDFIFARGIYAGRDIQNRPRVILLDLKMPKVSGLDVLKELATDEHISKVPVVVLTSSKQHMDVEKAYALGANSYIVKPVDFESFRKVVNDLGTYWLNANQPPA